MYPEENINKDEISLSFDNFVFVADLTKGYDRFECLYLDPSTDHEDYVANGGGESIRSSDIDQNEYVDVSDDEDEDNDISKFTDSIDTEESIISDDWCLNLYKSDDKNVVVKEKIHGTITRCRQLVTMTKKSTILSNYMNQLRNELKVTRGLARDCPTRWNSTFYLIESCLASKNLVAKLFGDKNLLNIRRDVSQKLSTIELQRNDWLILLDLYTVLKPFELATKLMSGKTYPTVGLCYYTLHKLKAYLVDDSIDSDSLKCFKRLLFDEFYFYFYFDENQLQLLQVYDIFELFVSYPELISIFRIKSAKKFHQTSLLFGRKEHCHSKRCCISHLLCFPFFSSE